MGQGISTPEDQVEDALDRINTALDDLRDLNLTGLPDKAVLGMTEKIQYTSCRLFAGLVRGVNEVDVRGLAAVNGASSTAMLIRQRLKMSSGQSNNLVRIGKATRCTVQPSGAVNPPELEEVADILDTGELNEESAGIIVRYMKTIPAEVDEPTRREVETTLLDQAVMFDPHQVRDAAREISVRIDPDGKLPKEATARMTFEIGNRNIDGLTKISGSLDDLTIERLKKALMGLSAPKPGPCGERDQRSAGQRQAHGLAELLDRFLKVGKAPAHGGVRPQVVVLMRLTDYLGGLPTDTLDVETVAAYLASRTSAAASVTGSSTENAYPQEGVGPELGELADPLTESCDRDLKQPAGTAYEAGAEAESCPDRQPAQEKSVRPWKQPGPGHPRVTPVEPESPLTDQLLGSLAPRATYGGALDLGTARMLACDADILPITLSGTSHILDVGRTARSFPPHLRKAATARDQGCSFPGCPTPADWTDGHHVIPWSQGGSTSLNNCALLCGFHHTVIHQGDWTMYIADDGHPEFIPPAWIDLQRRPVRNEVHRPHRGRD